MVSRLTGLPGFLRPLRHRPVTVHVSPSHLSHSFSQLERPSSSDLPMAKDGVAMAPTKREITHVVFDMDGLLLDTEPFYTVVQEKILERFGKTFDWSLKAKMMGKKAIESARIFVEECGLTGILTPEEFLEEREDMLQELFPTCQLLPGVKRLISHLHVNQIPMCVATGSYKRHFDLKTQRHSEIFSMMHHVVMGDDPDVKQGKPSPDIFLAAANRFEIFIRKMAKTLPSLPCGMTFCRRPQRSVDPAEVLVFEDAPAGVAAAKNAGMSVVMVPDPRLEASHLKEADQVLTSLLDFNPTQWALPPFPDDINREASAMLMS